jgi:hypothetical protein
MNFASYLAEMQTSGFRERRERIQAALLPLQRNTSEIWRVRAELRNCTDSARKERLRGELHALYQEEQGLFAALLRARNS